MSTPCARALTGHVRSFAETLTERQGQRLPEWLDAVRNDSLPSLHTLAAGIDRDAVIAGLTLPWNSGVVEGHVNRVKMLKRQMFDRAGFLLLRKRVLLYTVTDASGRLSRWLLPLIDSARSHAENQVLHGVRHRSEAGNPGLDEIDHAHFIDAQEEPPSG
ncbi:hypothetical protein [Streptomyces sp. NPDC012746]|uniref:hypothetical protein n=1 Tax=Streptomyces sp. NPDC012746 TaxID=3364845 RepID=UPI00369CFE63